HTNCTRDLIAIGFDYNLYANRESAVGVNSWNGWYQLQGGTATSIAATRTGDGRIAVFFIAGDGGPRDYFQSSPNVDNWLPMQRRSEERRVGKYATNADGT